MKGEVVLYCSAAGQRIEKTKLEKRGKGTVKGPRPDEVGRNRGQHQKKKGRSSSGRRTEKKIVGFQEGRPNKSGGEHFGGN